MKNLVFTLSFFSFLHVIFSQTIVIDVKEAKSNVGFGIIEFEQVFSEPDFEELPRKTDCRYVIDLSRGTSTFYRAGEFISEVKINVSEKSKGVYLIESFDTDLETYSLDVKTQMIIDTNASSQSFIYQYYDTSLERTIVDKITKFTIVRPS